jgi:rfaE bifunctional protein kinase chain/domain
MSITPDQTRVLLEKISKLRILVVGDVMLDHYIWGDATRISPEAPVPVVDIARDSWTAGGAANVALNLAALGAHTAVAGCIGHDDAGKKLKHILYEQNVQPIPVSNGGATIVKTRVMVQHQQLCRLDRESPPASYKVAPGSLDLLLGKVIQETDAVIISDYAKGMIDDLLVEKITGLARAAGKFIALDPKPRRQLAFHDLDLITPNKKESYQLAGIEPDPHAPYPSAQICARLHELYHTRYLVITLGEDGMLLSENGQAGQTIPTAAREVFDVSGAGDTALAALVLALRAGADLETAAHFANAASGVVVGKIGTATVTPAELLAYVLAGG